MTQLTPLKLEDGTVIYIEATEDISVPPTITETGEESPITFDTRNTRGIQQRMMHNFEAVEGTIRAYTSHTLCDSFPRNLNRGGLGAFVE